MRCAALWVLAAAIPDPRGWFRPGTDRGEDLARAHNPSSREEEIDTDADTKVEVDASGVPGADDAGDDEPLFEFPSFLETEDEAEEEQMIEEQERESVTYDMANPAGYCTLGSGGEPLCCRRAHEECGRNISNGGCNGIGGIGKECVLDCEEKSMDKDFCFLVHSDTSAEFAPVMDDSDIEIKKNSPMQLHVVWDLIDPFGNQKAAQEIDNDPSMLKQWTSWLKHVIPPLYKWLNPPVDPDPQMFWCVQSGMQRCSNNCLSAGDAAEQEGSEQAGSGSKTCMPFIQSIPPENPPSATMKGK